MNHILVIRGGAIGDFVLTLPAIKLLRDRFPSAHIEILGHNQITLLAHNRFYADAIRSIEEGSFAPFFSQEGALPAEVIDYFGSFDLILSYLFDPHKIFQGNVRRCGSMMFLEGPPKLTGCEHAARQLAQPLETIGLQLENSAAKIFPRPTDREHARDFLGSLEPPYVALHPGSGSETKNWPIDNWRQLGMALLSSGHALIVIGGEADQERLCQLEMAWKGQPVRFARNLALPYLAALLEDGIFAGHDSGISHIAAAVGAPSTLLFGPTDPAIWAPANDNVTVLQAPGGNLCLLGLSVVEGALLRACEARTTDGSRQPMS